MGCYLASIIDHESDMKLAANTYWRHFMTSYFCQLLFIVLLGSSLSCSTVYPSAELTDAVNAPSVESAAEPTKNEQTAVFAGGCFWGLEAVFEHVDGVMDVRSGYSGGTKATADYETVSEGKTGHAESVKIRFDQAKITYPQLLQVFFSVAHDPTQLNYQGPDHGTQYRSAIFYETEEQRQAAQAYIDELGRSGLYSAPIVTQLVPLQGFYDAESYHQNYMKRHPTDGYIVVNDAPKVAALREKFPTLYVER
jgi:peptide-methionine (S)-S-oxide reductase